MKTDLSTNSATFEVKGDFDFEAKLNEIVDSGNTHVKGWAKNAMAVEGKSKKGKGKKKKGADSLTSVSVKLPGMT